MKKSKSAPVRIARVEKNARGFAFLIPKDKSPDVFVPPDEASPLLQDDIVEFRISRSRGRPVGEIVRVIRRTQKEIIGLLSRDGNRWVLTALSGELFLVKADAALKNGNWVRASFERYPTKEREGLLKVEEHLGKELSPIHDFLITIARFGLPQDFSLATQEEVKHAESKSREAIQSPEKREDLRDIPLVTIDGEDAKDFDDAVCVLRNFHGSPFVLFVAIADVSFFVTPHSAVDKEARERGTSTYFPGTVIPMLPEGLSNRLCSLMPQEDRLALTAEIHFDRNGAVAKTRFYQSLIKTKARLTYTQVQAFFDKKETPPSSIDESVTSMRVLYRMLEKDRKHRGVLDFDLPESKIEVDEKGRPLSCYRAPRFESHKLIEEFMIAANSVVAKTLKESSTPALYRVHLRPELQSLDEVNQMMRNLGISKRIDDCTPKAFSKVIEATKGLKGSATLHKQILRLQKQAHYEPEPKGHFGLALSDYTHFTSPIRRYPDLVVHRALKDLIGVVSRSDKAREGSLEILGVSLSELERRSMEAERFIVRRKQCWFLKSHLGDVFEGSISGVIQKGLFVEISRFSIEGFVPLESLPGRYVFEEHRQALRQTPGHKTLSVGDTFSVLVENVSLERMEITLTPA